MLVETMKKFSDAQQSGNTDELAQLANLIKSLGGIDKVQSLLKGEATRNGKSSEKANSNRDNALSSQSATTLNFFAPSYVTPKRQMEAVTEAPVMAKQDPVRKEERRTHRQRRPQFDYPAETTTQATTTNALFSYYEKPKSSANQSPARSNVVSEQPVPERRNEGGSEFRRKANPKPFEFSYAMPDGRNAMMSAFNDMNARRIPAEMGMLANASMLQASPPDSSNTGRQVYRVPVRVQAGNLVKVPPEVIESNINGRRPQRIRVQTGFHVASDKAGVVYEDDFVLPKRPSVNNPEQFLPVNYDSNDNGITAPVQHQFGPPSYQFENNKLEGGSAKPTTSTQRRRPQNQFNAPYEESPINLLINTPPRSSSPDTRAKEELVMAVTTTPAPTTEYMPQTVKFTNYNTLPPEFDISPFTSPDFHNSVNANNFQKASSANRMSPMTSTTPMPVEEPAVIPRRPGGRRVKGPRRPIPQSQPEPVVSSTTTTTTRRPTRVQEYSEPVMDNFNGPAVFSEKEGGLGCSKRGVFAHPDSCGMFVVCAPAGRGKKGMRTLTHHCPADQVFVQEVGRCRPGNKDKCQVF